MAFVCRHVARPEDLLLRRDARRDERVHVNAVVVEEALPHHHRAEILTDVDRDDRRIGVTQLEAHSAELGAHIGEVLSELLLAPRLLLHDLESRYCRSDTRWSSARGEEEAVSKV